MKKYNAYPQHYPQIYQVCRRWRGCVAARRVASLLLACGCVGFAYCWPVAVLALPSSSSLGKTQTCLVLPSFARQFFVLAWHSELGSLCSCDVNLWLCWLRLLPSLSAEFKQACFCPRSSVSSFSLGIVRVNSALPSLMRQFVPKFLLSRQNPNLFGFALVRASVPLRSDKLWVNLACRSLIRAVRSSVRLRLLTLSTLRITECKPQRDNSEN